MVKLSYPSSGLQSKWWSQFCVMQSPFGAVWKKRFHHATPTTFRTAVRARIEFARKFKSILSKDFEISACNDVNISICIRIHVSIYIYTDTNIYKYMYIYKCFVCRFDCGIQLEDFMCPCLSIEVKSICLLFRFCVTPSASLCPGSSLRFFSVRTLFASSFLFCKRLKHAALSHPTPPQYVA